MIYKDMYIPLKTINERQPKSGLKINLGKSRKDQITLVLLRICISY